MPRKVKICAKLKFGGLFLSLIFRHLPQIKIDGHEVPSTWSEFLLLSTRQKGKVLEQFFKIAKKMNGDVYPNKTLKLIMDGIQRACREKFS